MMRALAIAVLLFAVTASVPALQPPMLTLSRGASGIQRSIAANDVNSNIRVVLSTKEPAASDGGDGAERHARCRVS